MTFRLVRDHISRDTVTACEQLLEGARSGLITGMVFGCSLKGRRYFVNVSGSLADEPTLARGVAAALDDELRAMVQNISDTSLTL